ncbi:MAG: ABC transporter ATP-binding protein [Acidimicrobiales bacterium]
MRLRRRSPIDLDQSELRHAFTVFRPALRGQSHRMAAALGLALGVTTLELLKPWPITLALDHLIGQDGASVAFTPIVLFAAAAFAIPGFLGLLGERLQIVIAQISRKATVRIRADVFDHIQRLELAEHQKHYSGDLLIRLMGDVNMIRDLLFPSWVTLLSRGSVLIGGAVVFAVVEWRLFVVALVPLPLLWVSVDRGSAAVKAAAGKQRRKEGAIAAQAAETLTRVSLIKAFNAEDRISHRFRSQARSAERASMASTRKSARMASLSELLTGAGVALVLLLGARRVQAGLLTPGQLILAVSYTRMIYKPIRKLTGEGARLAKATACALRVIELLERPVEAGDRGKPTSSLGGDIEFVGVSHRYPDGRQSLDKLDAVIPADSMTAVVGRNGSGKSTMIGLLLRLLRPSGGNVHIGGVDVSTYRLDQYRQQLAYVPQELTLFGGTIRENIAFGKPDATDAELTIAAELAMLGPVLERLPNGLDTELDEGGTSLSGGEARRVMLARAAVRDSSVMLLDEPLVGLDPAARTTVARAISRVAHGRTTVVIHHGDLTDLAPDSIIELDPEDAGGPELKVVAT